MSTESRFIVDRRIGIVAVLDTHDAAYVGDAPQGYDTPAAVAVWVGVAGCPVTPDQIKMARRVCQLLNDDADAQDQLDHLVRTSSVAADIEQHRCLVDDLNNQRIINRDLTSLVERLEQQLEKGKSHASSLERSRDQHNRDEHEMQTRLDKGVLEHNRVQDALVAVTKERDTARSELGKTNAKVQELRETAEDQRAEINTLEARLSSQRNHEATTAEVAAWQTANDRLRADIKRYRFGIEQAAHAAASIGTREQLRQLLAPSNSSRPTPLDRTLASVERGLEQARRGEFAAAPDLQKAAEVAAACQDPDDEIKWTQRLGAIRNRTRAQWDGFNLMVQTSGDSWHWQVMSDDLMPPLVAEGTAKSKAEACSLAATAARNENDTWDDDQWDDQKEKLSTQVKCATLAKPDPVEPLQVAAAQVELAERYCAEHDPDEATACCIEAVTSLLKWAREQDD